MNLCLKRLLPGLLLILINGCTVGPDYQRPPTNAPAEFKELKGWKPANPQDTALPAQWWTIFNDATLNALEQQVAANQSIIQAEAQYRQAQHLVQGAQAAYSPIANLTGTVNRFRASSGQSVAVSGVRDLFSSATSIAWEPDLWGGVRRQVEANISEAQASAASLHGLVLAIQAAVAENYFRLWALDAQTALLDETATAYRKMLDITQNRYAAGVAAKSDVVQAQMQWEATRAQAINLGVQRAKLEHAIAVLIGKSPSELTLQAMPLDELAPPSIPLSVPSELLERRPDIAAAERKMAAANAQIGVAKAAYFPSLSLAANNGFQSSQINTLFSAASRYWALGPASAALTLFDGGAKNARYKQAIDAYEAHVAAYRQTVLTGFQEVEDQLAALRILQEEQQTQQRAVVAAKQALALTLNQYQAGVVGYLNVMTAQTAALSQQQTAVQLQGERLTASVLLVKALGGGWHETRLPNEEQAVGEREWTDLLIFPVE